MAKLSESAWNMLSKQMNLEFVASHAYLKAAYWFDDLNYDGIFKYLKVSRADCRKNLKLSDLMVFVLAITSQCEATCQNLLQLNFRTTSGRSLWKFLKPFSTWRWNSSTTTRKYQRI